MTPPESALFDALMSQGMAASRANDSTQAIECFLGASEARPSAGLPQFMLGSEFAALGFTDKAEAAFANAARLAPDFALARYQLGLLQFSAGRAAMALLTWEPLLQLPDTDPLPHFVRGFGALAHDRFDAAISHYQRGLALNTANSALSDDIEKMMAGIRAVATHAPATSGNSSPAVVSEAEAHVLLANYQQQGRAH